jgi:hypothetical protein
MKWRWPWKHGNGQDAKLIRELAERELAAERQVTPLVERMAGKVSALPPEEFVERVARALKPRPS